MARAPLAAALRGLLPDHMIRLGKKLVNATEQDSGSVILEFIDGSTADADCLIGCDGVNSAVRTLVLGANHPALLPKNTGGYGFRTLVSIEDARSAFGTEYCQDRTQRIHLGDGGALLTDYSDDGNSMQLIAGFSADNPWPYDAPWAPWPQRDFEESLARWGQIGNAMSSLYAVQGKLYAAASRWHEAAPTYVRGCLCVAGDAAHTFSPARGSGAGQAIEDALLLRAVLAETHARDRIPAALAVYDLIRRPRRTMIAAMSSQGGRLLTGREPGVGLDIEKWRAQLSIWNKEIYDYDLESACAAAVQALNENE